MKLKKPVQKKYPLHQSPLYKLQSRKKLCELLHMSYSELEKLRANPHYNVFRKGMGEKGRDIQEPRGRSRLAHDRLKNLLCRIETPPYLFSGISGKSAIDNAIHHQESEYFLALDIEKFGSSGKLVG